MDPSSSHDDQGPDEAIWALVDEFLERRQAGEDLSPERFAAEHADVAEALLPILPGLPLIEKACQLGTDGVAGDAAPAAGGLPPIEGYELIGQIGRGGMGVVYKALQVSTKRVVALKVMLGGPFAAPSALRRFEREVELAARLQHPGIVRVLESGEVAGQRYFAMDYVEGVTLDRYLSTAQPEVDTTLRLFAQMCGAVDDAHRHGVVHRDLKPGNVLIDDEGNPHILDFGLAKATDCSDSAEALTAMVSSPGQVLGTLRYLSPEQAAGMPDEIDPRTDVYALGVVLFEALTGLLPFDATGRPSQVVQRILEAPPAPPSSLSKRVDAELEMILLKALEKEKSRRYQSAREMAEDIRRYLEGEPILARRPSSLYVLRKKLRKHRVRVALGVAAVVLVSGGLLRQARSRQRRWSQARAAALVLQRNMEAGADVTGRAGVFSEQNPGLCEAQLIHAHALHRHEQSYGTAIPLLEAALQREPSLWALRTLLAEIYREAGDAERADALQAQAERDAPDTAEAWYLRSFATLNLARALRCAQQAVQREPSHVLVWERLAYLLLETGDPDGALHAVDRLIELGENARNWTTFKGRVLARQGRLHQAIELFTEYGLYRDRAHTYRRLKEYDKAVADYTRVMGARGEAIATWDFYQRATPLWILGRTDEALEDYRRVRILLGQPGYSDARRFLILCELGRRSEAEEVLAAALRDVEQAALRDVKAAWLQQIFHSLAGQLAPDELVAYALSRNNLEHLCEAYYYAGEACLLAGDRDQACKWFEHCVQTGVDFDPDTPEFGTPMNEFELAQWRLDTLFADGTPASHPRRN